MKKALITIAGIALGLVLSGGIKSAFFPDRGSVVSSITSNRETTQQWLMTPIEVPDSEHLELLVGNVLSAIAAGPKNRQQEICDEISFISYSTLKFQDRDKDVLVMGNAAFYAVGFTTIFKMARAEGRLNLGMIVQLAEGIRKENPKWKNEFLKIKDTFTLTEKLD